MGNTKLTKLTFLPQGSNPRLIETLKILGCQDWPKVVETETLSRVSIFTAPLWNEVLPCDYIFVLTEIRHAQHKSNVCAVLQHKFFLYIWTNLQCNTQIPRKFIKTTYFHNFLIPWISLTQDKHGRIHSKWEN